MDPQPSSSVPPQPVRAQVVQELPTRIILEQSGSGLGRFGRRLIWVALGISVLANISLFATYESYFQDDTEITEKYHSLSKTATDKIAILTVEGAIMAGEGFAKKQIDKIREDDNVKAIVLRVDSPGGTVTGSDYIYHHLKELLKEKQVPLVVSMGSVAASGGYYIAMAAGDKNKNIFAEPTTWTGSIGVIIPHYDVSKLLTKWEVADDSISSHPMKQMGSPTHTFTPEQRAEEQKILKELVDQSFSGFKDIVLANRPALREDAELQKTVFTGRIFTAPQAKQTGLVDELGFIEDAINRAVQLAKLDKDDVRVVKYKKPSTIFDSAFGASSRAPVGLDLSAILDLTAPRAYYLCTWLPAVMLSPRQ